MCQLVIFGLQLFSVFNNVASILAVCNNIASTVQPLLSLMIIDYNRMDCGA